MIPEHEPLDVVHEVTARAFTIPTDAPEADGTLEWDATTVVLAEVAGGGHRGIGYTYCDAAAAAVITNVLAPTVLGHPIVGTGLSWAAMVRSLRNVGRSGVGACALSAVDIALWDLKARVLDVPVSMLAGRFRTSIPAYGSGGFTSYSDGQLTQQLAGWAASGMTWVKMKIGRNWAADQGRIRMVRDAIGSAALYVDANGSWTRSQALARAPALADLGVRWLEEPVTSDDLEGMRAVRQLRLPDLEVAAGEYGYDTAYFDRMLHAGAVDCLQADVTRCGGLTGFLGAAAVADAHGIELSAHTAPTVSAHACAGAPRLRHLEYFHDHVRVEHLVFDGAVASRRGCVELPEDRPGLGIALKESDAAPFRVA